MKKAARSEISADAFAARLHELGAPQSYAVAVSGGADSMALALLAASHKAKSGANVIALTVDHGLRPEAAGEADRAAAWCARLGVPHQILRWRGAKPSCGLQAAARAARYSLLIDAAQRAGAQALLTAHTSGDQAETLCMRLARGGGASALGAMAAHTLVASESGQPMPLLRPLLYVDRDALVCILQSAGQEYVDDPSNDDPTYERVRVRALLGALEENGFLTGALLARTARLLKQDSARMRDAENALFRSLGGFFYSWGGANLDRLAADHPSFSGLLRRLFHAVGGGEYPPDLGAAETSVAIAFENGAATLGGAVLRRWRGRWLLVREPAALTGRAGVAPVRAVDLCDRPLLWDRRFVLSAQSAIGELRVAPCHKAEFTGYSACHLPPEALASSPGIYLGDALIGAPAFPSLANGGVNALSLIPERFCGEVVRFSAQTAEISGESDGAGLS